MNELIKNIFSVKKSKSYIDYEKYHKGNIFGITKVSRLEKMHSNFIAWLLNANSSHGLHTYAVQQLIMCLELIKGKPDNMDAQLDLNVIRESYLDDFIIDTDIEMEKDNVDICILAKTKANKTLPILIENKVNSDENNNQTEKYYEYGENRFGKKTLYYNPIYILLYPEYNKIKQSSDKYLRMTYQEMVDFVIEPAFYKSRDNETKNNIKTYLQCLSYQDDNEKGDKYMAISAEEKKILDSFLKENKNLLCAVLDELNVDVDNSAFEEVKTIIRDYSTYLFDNNEYNKRRLVLAVIKKYVDDKNPSTFKELEKAFPWEIHGSESRGVIKLESEVSEKDKGIGSPQKRYFVEDPIILTSGERVLVTTEWGVGNIGKFIKAATEKGYTIEQV